MNVTMYSMSMFHAFNHMPYQVETTNEYLLKEFVRQVRNGKTAITVGHVGGILSYTVEKGKWEQSLTFNPQGLKTYQSKTDPSVQIIAADILMDKYTDTIYPVIVRTPFGLRESGVDLLLNVLREDSQIGKDKILLFMRLVLLVAKRIGEGKIDYIKLSTNPKFHAVNIQDIMNNG